jgi:DNA-binding IclR family transcriptional regulator
MSQSLKNGIDALLFLADRKSAGVTELASSLKVNKSTAFRILNTFMEDNMVEKNKDTLKYRLGPAILRLSEQYYHNFNIIESARPVMEKLAAEIHESIHLCILSNNSAVVIEQMMSSSRLLVNAKVGNSEPLHCSSVGKCLLAFTSEENREKMIDGISFSVFTGKTIKDRNRLNEEIKRVQELGYAIDDEELSEHVRCVAVPVFDERGMCIHSLGASGAASRMTDEKIERIVPLLLKAAKSIVIRKGGTIIWQTV